MKEKQIAIFGAGLVGSLLSVFMSKQGYRVHVYEKRADPRLENMQGNRSINLALSERGWRALREIGIDHLVHPIAIPMKGRMIHAVNGKLAFQPYGMKEQAIYSVSRMQLNEIMIRQADQMKNTYFHFEHSCSEVNIKDNTYRIKNGQNVKVEKADLIFGADGAFSRVRGAMQRTDRFNYSQHYLEYGYKELTMPVGQNHSFCMNPNALHIWPRKNFMLIALPNPDKTFTVTLFLPFEGNISFENLQTEKKISTFFRTYFPDTTPFIEDFTEQFLKNPTSSMVTINCSPWTHLNRIALVGDAAHAIVPFYGQGMNAGFEDCRILNNVISQNPNHDWSKILKEYEKKRIENANAISQLALSNFIEMRDKVADASFLLRKKIEAHLHQLFPEEWIPLYSMVTFSHIPYAEALSKGKRQDEIMNQVLETPHLEHKWQELDFDAIISKL